MKRFIFAAITFTLLSSVAAPNDANASVVRVDGFLYNCSGKWQGVQEIINLLAYNRIGTSWQVRRQIAIRAKCQKVR